MIPASLTSPALKMDTAGIYEGGSIHPSIYFLGGSQKIVPPLRVTSLLTRFIDTVSPAVLCVNILR